MLSDATIGLLEVTAFALRLPKSYIERFRYLEIVKFTLAVCKANKISAFGRKGYVVFVIKNNNLPLYEDLVAAIESGKEYLVLVDDTTLSVLTPVTHQTTA